MMCAKLYHVSKLRSILIEADSKVGLEPCKKQTRADKAITADDVNESWKNGVEQKRRPTDRNSFAAPNAAYEYQTDVDLVF